jgi:serine/threonine protein kinase
VSESEHLREALLDLERARLREQQRRQESSSLQAGMAALTLSGDRATVFAHLFQAFRAALDFVDAFVLTAGTGSAEGTWRTVAATSRTFENRQWHGGALFQRVRSGTSAPVFDVRQVPEWQAHEGPEFRWSDEDVVSALHVESSARDRTAMLVFTHVKHGAFGPREAKLARRFAPLISQALLKAGQDRWANYEVLEKIGTGGMGEVYLARQRMARGLDRQVILKTILPELARHMPFVHQFLDEARVASTLNHPNIVSIYEVGESEGGWFIAMEYIRGVDLMQLMNAYWHNAKPVPATAIAMLVRDAARGLYHAHTAVDGEGVPLNIVHRDVSPQNLMARVDGVTKVLDFGIAKSANRLENTMPGTFRGKLSYMSPEQASGDDLDARSDQFSLGVVAWELCTGQRLFQTDSPIKTMRRLLAGVVPRPRSIRPDLPEALEIAVLRMLRSRREDRYPDCNEVANALDALVRRSEPDFNLGAVVLECVDTLTRLARGAADSGAVSYRGDDATLLSTPDFAEEEEP